jgi:hypothetical protein
MFFACVGERQSPPQVTAILRKGETNHENQNECESWWDEHAAQPDGNSQSEGEERCQGWRD